MGDFHDASTLGAWRTLSDRMAAVDLTGSPLACGPGPAILLLTILVPDRRLIHPWLLALGALAATLVPLVFRERIVTDGGDLVTPMVSLQDKDTRAVRHTLQMQQWQLSHLVPGDVARP